MQVIFEDENEGSSSEEANLVGTVVYAEWVSKYIEGKITRRSGIEGSRI